MQTIKNRAFAILGALAAGTAGLATAAHADVPRMRVSYADIDLASRDGQAMLTHRIGRAAREVCDVDGYDKVAISACREKAMDKAEADLARRGITLR